MSQKSAEEHLISGNFSLGDDDIEALLHNTQVLINDEHDPILGRVKLEREKGQPADEDSVDEDWQQLSFINDFDTIGPSTESSPTGPRSPFSSLKISQNPSVSRTAPTAIASTANQKARPLLRSFAASCAHAAALPRFLAARSFGSIFLVWLVRHSPDSRDLPAWGLVALQVSSRNTESNKTNDELAKQFNKRIMHSKNKTAFAKTLWRFTKIMKFNSRSSPWIRS